VAGVPTCTGRQVEDRLSMHVFALREQFCGSQKRERESSSMIITHHRQRDSLVERVEICPHVGQTTALSLESKRIDNIRAANPLNALRGYSGLNTLSKALT